MPDQITVPLGELQRTQVPTTFAIVNGQRVPVTETEPAAGPLTVPLGELQASPTSDAEPQNLWTLAKHVGAGVNPLTAIETIANAIMSPVETGKAMGAAQGAVFDKAQQAFRRGDYGTAARHFVDYLIPMVGPALDKSADEMQEGLWASGGGDAIGLGLSLFAPGAIAHARAARAATAGRAGTGAPILQAPVTRGNLTPIEQASNTFAEQRGVPLDAATATGSPFVRGVQKVAGESMLGAPAIAGARAAQLGALTRVGGEIADAVHPTAVTAEGSGAGIQSTMEGLIGDMHKAANDAYGDVRQIEQDPRNAELVQTAPRGSRAQASILGKLAAGTENGVGPSVPELVEMRRMLDELENLPYEPGKLVADEPGVSGASHYARGTGGGPVFHEIRAAMPSEGTVNATRAEVLGGLKKTLETGEWTQAARGAWEVAKERAKGNGSLADPYTLLPRNAPLVGTTERIGMPVELKAAQKALQPVYERLSREAELVPLQGDKAKALVVLDRLMNGPSVVSLSTADAALGDLKALARGADLPELRSAGQGVAARAVRELEQAVQDATRRATGDAAQALERGRAATRAKYLIADVLDRLRTEPVKIFDQLTAPKDGAIELLRQVQEVAPGRMAEIGRAKLEQWLDLATERDRFDHADRIYAEWQKMGPETKKILFGTAGQIDNLDRFFLLAKRIAANPNPSGTAPTLLKMGEVTGLVTNPLASIPVSLTMGGIAKLLYAPAGVKALTRLLRLNVGAGAARAGSAVRTGAERAAYLELANAARSAGVPLAAGPAGDQSQGR